MAAEALKKAAAQHGYEIKVETQGSVGAKNTLTAEEIAAADVVIIAPTRTSTPAASPARQYTKPRSAGR